jgi:hypothetical protein
MKEYIIYLYRLNITPYYTEGVMYDHCQFICDTLEDTVRDIDGSGYFDNGEVKIYGETSIPYGKRRLKVSYSPKFKRLMVAVLNVPSFKGIRLHWARTAKQLLGCVGVGKYKSDGVLDNSYMTDKLVDIVRKKEDEGYEVYLDVVS